MNKNVILVKMAKLQDEYKSSMIELLQDPPSTVEREAHKEIVQNLTPQQKAAVETLEAFAKLNGNFIQ